MRGRPKSLKPLATGPVERVLRQVAAEDPAAAGLLLAREVVMELIRT